LQEVRTLKAQKKEMGKGSEASKFDDKNYPEELREVARAALLFSSIRHMILDKETATTLEALKRKYKAATKPPESSLPIEPYNPPEIPPVQSLISLIGACSKPFEKQLTDSDIRDDQSRLSMNKQDVENFLLPLLGGDENVNLGIPVTTYDLEGKAYPMVFKQWASKIYILTGGWKRFSHEHYLSRHEDFVTIWMFRHNVAGNLCFVISSRRLPVFEPIKRRRTTSHN
jgi:hypothetical protein